MSMDDDSTALPGGDDALVGEYVLGVLDERAHAELAARMATEPELRRTARFWRDRFSDMDEGYAEVPPPLEAFGKIERHLFGPPDTQSAAAAFWNSLAIWRGIAMGGVAVALLMVGLTVLRPAPLTPENFATQLAAALDAEGSSVKFMALYDGQTGRVRLTALSGQAVPDRDFELWFIHGDQAPESLGVVPIDHRVEVALTPEMRAQVGSDTVFAITLEPKGGAPEGKPTGPIVAKGAVTRI